MQHSEHHQKAKERLWHYSHATAHCAYLGAAFVEGHGIYANAAAILFVFVVVATFSGQSVLE